MKEKHREVEFLEVPLELKYLITQKCLNYANYKVNFPYLEDEDLDFSSDQDLYIGIIDIPKAWRSLMETIECMLKSNLAMFDR